MLVATAGHIDHGKSTLVRALTGTDPDRWADEKRRGITIDLGFAHSMLPSGAELSFVDVPGHVKFLGNMLAGVAAVDACLFVVAATEGWKAQSEEHLRILEVLGVRHAVIAVTKVALVDEDSLEIVRLQIADRLGGTPLDVAEVVDVDTPTGVGLDEIVAALDRVAAVVPARRDRARPRLWIDRSFSAKGAGTIVTGTLIDGALAIGQELAIFPGGLQVRVRGLQHHGAPAESVLPGTRTAANLAGAPHHEVRRGAALVREDQWHPTDVFDASLTIFSDLDHPIRSRRDYLVHVGSGEHRASARVIGATGVDPGSTGAVRLHLPVKLPLLPGDRYVLRDAARNEVVGGGEILDVDPVLPASRATPTAAVDRVVAERGWVQPATLERLTGERRAPNLSGWIVDPVRLAAAVDDLGQAVVAAGPLGLDVAALSEHERAVLSILEDVEVVGGMARSKGAVDPLDGHPYVAALEASPFSPPPPDDVPRGEVRELVRRGTVVEQAGVYFAASAVAEASNAVALMLRDQPEGVTVAEIRDRLGTSRKFLLPLLALLDAHGITRRRGDFRIAGPRLPEV